MLAMLKDSRTESERIRDIDDRLEALKTARSSEYMDKDKNDEDAEIVSNEANPCCISISVG